jgi:hypothetical protein
MDTSEIMEIIRESFDAENCIACDPECLALFDMPIPPVTLCDALGIRWCTAHQFRGEFVNIMSVCGWPALEEYDEDRVRISQKIEGKMMKAFEQPFYAIAAGAWATVQIALNGSDEAVTALALKAMELQSQQQGEVA